MSDERAHSDQEDSSSNQAPTTYRQEFDPSERAPSNVLISAVTEIKDTSAVNLPPLYRVFDPDALDALIQPTPSGRIRTSDQQVCFTYADCNVRIHSDGNLVLRCEDGTEDESSG